VQIALATARNHTWSIPLDDDTLDPNNFNNIKSVSWTNLAFDCAIGANVANRSSNPLELYPVWQIGIVLNKWYGYLYGIEIDVWADNGQVRSVQEEYSSLPPPADVPTANPVGQTSNPTQTTASLALMISLPIIALAATAIAYLRAKNKQLHGYGMVRRRSFRTAGTLLCILLFSTVLLNALSTASATTRGAYIWGSRCSGAPNSPVSQSWRKTDLEITFQNNAAINIYNDFAAAGYDTQNNQGDHGSTSMKSSIMNTMSNYFSSDDYIAVVDFDHGVGAQPVNASNEDHYMFEDDYGTHIGPWYDYDIDYNHGVFDMDIFPYGGWKVAFAFINTCLSADTELWGQGNVYGDGNMVGMPYAFTHKLVAGPMDPYSQTYMAQYGYDYPDNGHQVYIGFPFGSAALSQRVPWDGSGPYYYYWVVAFFGFALTWDISVHDALDYASAQQWGESYDFGNCPLSLGFTACWPTYNGTIEDWDNDTGAGSYMAVYGNSRIHLLEYEPPEYVSPPNINGDTSGDTYETLNFTASSVDTLNHQVRYFIDWDDDSQTQTDWYNSGSTIYPSHSWNSSGQKTITITAESDQGVWSSSSYYLVNIGPPVYHWLTVNGYFPYFQAELHPNVWIDDNWVGTAPVTVQVTSYYHTVRVDNYIPLLPGLSAMFYCMIDSNNNVYYTYSTSILVNTDTTVTAYYNYVW
jgi:hypothetical protein